MSSTPFLLGVLFLACSLKDVFSEKVLDVLKGSVAVLRPDVKEASITSVTWKHRADLAAEWFGGNPTFYRSFKGRCILNDTTGEFMIADVKLEDGGSYTPEINNNIQPAITLRVYSPVPKPNITHDCKPEQTQCTLTCSFDKTDDMGDVQIFWIVDDRREKGGGALEITKETKEKTFICRLENSVSSENSNKLQNPLLTIDESGRTRIVGIVLGLLAVLAVGVCVAVCLILRHKSKKEFFISGQLKE